ncbi:hypothetical protein MSKU15_1370 [Komagataeibacter diospyri]|nr:hypothetical protein MSKU15_1370 [Komagataeibacter diospyri]
MIPLIIPRSSPQRKLHFCGATSHNHCHGMVLKGKPDCLLRQAIFAHFSAAAENIKAGSYLRPRSELLKLELREIPAIAQFAYNSIRQYTHIP